jgi:hypothetical protein
MTFPAQAMQILVELQVGEGGTWVDVTEDLRMSSGVDISRGRQDEASEVNPGKCTLVLNNRHGKYSEFNPDGPYYGRITKNTPIRVSVAPFGDGVYYPRFAGEVSKWPPRWDISDTDVWVPIEAAGILRRLRSGSERAVSALQRYITFNEPSGYWPLTDGETAIQGAPVFGSFPFRAIASGGGALFKNQPDWGKGTLAPWMEPVINLAPQSSGEMFVPAEKNNQSTWSVDYFRSGTGYIGTLSAFDIGDRSDDDPVTIWSVIANSTTADVQLYVGVTGETTSSLTQLQDLNSPGIFDGNPHHIRLTCGPNATVSTSTDYVLYIDGEEVASGTFAVTSRPLGKLMYIWNQIRETPEPTNMSVGHIAQWGPTPPDADLVYRALLGYDGELAGRRIERLCAERGIGLEVHGDLDATQPCGPQQVDSFIKLAQDAADVDGGVLGESTEDLALLYRTQRSKYNQGSVL